MTNEEILLALRDVATSLTAKIDAVSAVQAEHGKAISQLQIDAKTLQADMTEVKHTIGVNQLKLSGKIEMVASMLADHMVDHHEPAGRKRA